MGVKGSFLNWVGIGHATVMARKLRVEYPGVIYRVMNRGDRDQPIFVAVADRRRFVETLAEACATTGRQVYADVLMHKHFRFVVESPQPNLVAGRPSRSRRSGAAGDWARRRFGRSCWRA